MYIIPWNDHTISWLVSLEEAYRDTWAKYCINYPVGFSFARISEEIENFNLFLNIVTGRLKNVAI